MRTAIVGLTALLTLIACDSGKQQLDQQSPPAVAELFPVRHEPAEQSPEEALRNACAGVYFSYTGLTKNLASTKAQMRYSDILPATQDTIAWAYQSHKKRMMDLLPILETSPARFTPKMQPVLHLIGEAERKLDAWYSAEAARAEDNPRDFGKSYEEFFVAQNLVADAAAQLVASSPTDSEELLKYEYSGGSACRSTKSVCRVTPDMFEGMVQQRESRVQRQEKKYLEKLRQQ